MRIFELLDQYEGICRRFFFGCSAKLNKTFKANLIEILILIMGRTPKDKLSSARTLRMVQTLNASELKAKSMTFSEWYLSVLKRHRDNLLKITPLLVSDAAFSNLPFVTGLKETGFSLISCLRSNAVLFYIYDGSRTGKRGRPKTKDVKIDFTNPDKSRMKRIDIDTHEGEAYELIAWNKSLYRKYA